MEIGMLIDHDLSDSTRQLAQAERDKAWSGMARQVAHEIKNPLTPIKLQLQMLIRMKQSGKPGWEEKFEEVSSIILEQIGILAQKWASQALSFTAPNINHRVLCMSFVYTCPAHRWW